MQASKEAQKAVENGLSDQEMLRVARVIEQWNAQNAEDSEAKRLFTKEHLPSLVEKFLDEISRTCSVEIFMLAGFPHPDGEIKVSSFETKPAKGVKAFSKSNEWKECGVEGTGFDQHLARRWPNLEQATKAAQGTHDDLIYEAERHLDADIPNLPPLLPMPLLTPFGSSWTLARIRPAWRLYCNRLLECQMNQKGLTVGWAKVSKKPESYVRLPEGVQIIWGDPSRLNRPELVKNWKMVVKHQFTVNDEGQTVGQYPFEFLPKAATKEGKKLDRYATRLANARARSNYVEVSDPDDEDDEDKEDDTDDDDADDDDADEDDADEQDSDEDDTDKDDTDEDNTDSDNSDDAKDRDSDVSIDLHGGKPGSGKSRGAAKGNKRSASSMKSSKGDGTDSGADSPVESSGPAPPKKRKRKDDTGKKARPQALSQPRRSGRLSMANPHAMDISEPEQPVVSKDKGKQRAESN
ncbi:hypothetical protein HWV62_8170, partial [Athelia sp. TMB]